MISSKITITILAASCFPTTLVCATEFVIGKSGEFCSTSPLTLSECKDYADEIGKPIDVNSRSDIHPGCSLTSSSVNFNKNTESLSALSSYQPVCSTADSAGAGGSHFFGFGHKFFKWHGDFNTILFKTPKLSETDPGIEAHIRTKKLRKWCVISGIAMKVGNDTVEIGSEKGNLLLNGSEIDSVKSDWFSVTKSFSGIHNGLILYDFVVGKDIRLNLKVDVMTGTIYISLNGHYPHGTVGLLGSPHSPGLITRDGRNMTGYDMNLYAETWKVLDSDPQLFRKQRVPQPHSTKKHRVRARRRNGSRFITLQAGIACVAFFLISISKKISL